MRKFPGTHRRAYDAPMFSPIRRSPALIALCASMLIATSGLVSVDRATARGGSSADARSIVSTEKAVGASTRVNVSKRIGPEGGLLQSRSGAALYVPPGVMRSKGRVSIRRLRGGRFSFHIGARWSGTVGVTMPRVRRSEVVSHRVGGIWLPEGRPGQRTVWVTQLSWFDTVKAKAKAAACFLTLSKRKIIECLAKKLPFKITKDVSSWLADKLGKNCVAAIISNGYLAPIAQVWEEACQVKAGEGDFKYTPAPAPTPLPVTTNPGGAVNPGTINPQPAVPVPAPTPAPGPVPAPAPAPAPTWSEQQGTLGANTFTNPYNASGMGVKIPAMAWVAVSCKVHAPAIASANPDGYWYRIASAPWSNAYYAVANTFWNGDIPGQKPYTHNTDWAVPNC